MNCRSNYRFHRVNRHLPCPVCGHDGWCLLSPFGERAVCCRVESESPAHAFDGWFHEIPPRIRPLPSNISAALPPITHHELRDFTAQQQVHIAHFGPDQRAHAAAALSLDPCVFDSFPIGYEPLMDALAIPSMQHAEPVFVEIRYRRLALHAAGPKWSCAAGSTAGLLLPLCAPSSSEPILLCEGPSDTLAASQLGLHSIGRWSCGLDTRQAVTLRAHTASITKPTIVVVGDNDERLTGERGADAAAVLIAETIPHAVVLRVQPPSDIKDLREWTMNGATAADVLHAAVEVRHGS